MDRKRGLIGFMLVFAFAILSFNFISAAVVCDVRTVATCPAVNTVMKLSATTNAHGEIYSQTHYPYALCCFGMTYYSAADNASMHTCDGTSNLVLKLSSQTNAHAQVITQTGYTTNVCFGHFSCSALPACDTDFPIQMVSLSSPTNAHLAQFSSTYATKICCYDDSPAVCGNSIIEAGESCDCGLDGSCTLAELNSATCASVLLNPAAVGTLSCTPPPTGCKYNTAGCCIPETNNAFCTRLGVECGSRTALDNCGISRTVNCGTCVLPETCQSGTCACTAETDAQFCSRLGRTCGSLTAADNCGTTRTVASCGTCNDGSLCTTDSCNAGSCVYTPITCNDGNVCTGDSCNVLIGCVYNPLTGPACTDDGNPCTLDLCSGGSCTHPAISNCCTLNSQCNDNNACTASDTCNLGTHTCSNPVLSCGVNNDGCCPSGCYSGDDNDCTICGDNGDCNDGNACTTNICSGGACTYPPIISCTNGDGCCPSGCNAVNDNDCTADCGNGVRENPPELCDGSQLGGATCASLLGAGYTGTPTCYAAETPNECTYNTAGCVPPCLLTDADWSVSTPVGGPYMVEGTSVSLNIVGTNCGGKAISFEIREKDALGGDDAVSINPASILFPSSGTTASGEWTAEWQTEGWPETDPPEYYFIATTTGSTYTSPNSGVNDAGLLRVSELVTCGNGAIDPPLENCDEGAANNGIVCVPAYGSSCTYCSSGCTTTTVDGAYCGDTTCNSGNEDCSSCPADCGACPVTCTILDAYWNVTSIIANGRVRLNVEASNCGGETVTFEVFEDDGSFGDDDITTATPAGTNPNSITFPSSGNLGFVDWNAFYMEDDEIGQSYPPEFYFTATILSEEIDSDLLEVLNAGACAGITYCSDYKTQGECDPDLCTAGENEPTCDETPTYDPITRCTTTPECDCQWVGDPTTGSCQPETIIGTPVCDNYACQPGVDECWLGGDACQVNSDSCTCEDGYNPNALGYCTPAHVCDPLTDICWLQGDLCTDECICQTGYTPNGDGTCGASNPNVCDPATDDCWLMGDKCQYDCTCEVGYTPNGLGYCDPIHVCDSLDECWILGNGCQDDCTCTNNDPDGSGGCMSGGSLPNLGTSTCAYTTSGTDTCGEGVTVIERTIVGIMNWDPLNNFLSVPSWGVEGVNIFLRDGAYRYDPSNQYTECTTPRTQSIQCPATVELPFFGIYQVVLVIAIVGLIYLVYVLRKDDSKKSKSGRKYKKRK